MFIIVVLICIFFIGALAYVFLELCSKDSPPEIPSTCPDVPRVVKKQETRNICRITPTSHTKSQQPEKKKPSSFVRFAMLIAATALIIVAYFSVGAYYPSLLSPLLSAWSNIHVGGDSSSGSSKVVQSSSGKSVDLTPKPKPTATQNRSPVVTPSPTPKSTPPTSTPTHTPTLRPTPTTTPTTTPIPGSGITLRATSTGNNGTGGSSLTIPAPSGTASNIVLIAHVIVRQAGNTITSPTGWTLIKRQDSSSTISTATYLRVAGSSEPTNYTWNFGTSGEASGGIASYIGANTTNPIDASKAQYNSATSTVSNSGVTTTSANDMLVFIAGVILATTVNPPSGFHEEWTTTSSSDTTSEMSDKVQTAIGTTGNIRGSHNSGDNTNITYLIALKPAS